MSILLLAGLIGVGAFGAGLLGALTGLGGGIIVVPMLTLLFHVDLRYAVGASLVSVIATSSGAAAAYVREGYTNVRVGILLEVATTVGALLGAALAGVISTGALSVLIFSGLLIVIAIDHPFAGTVRVEPEPLAAVLADPGGPSVPLDDVVPGDPEPATQAGTP